MPVGGQPVAVSFSDDGLSLVAASQSLSGSSLYMYGVEKPKPSEEVKQQPKLPLPEIKWEHHKVHEKLGILTLSGTTASYGSADGSTIVASCSEGIFLFSYPAIEIARMLLFNMFLTLCYLMTLK